MQQQEGEREEEEEEEEDDEEEEEGEELKGRRMMAVRGAVLHLIQANYALVLSFMQTTRAMQTTQTEGRGTENSSPAAAAAVAAAAAGAGAGVGPDGASAGAGSTATATATAALEALKTALSESVKSVRSVESSSEEAAGGSKAEADTDEPEPLQASGAEAPAFAAGVRQRCPEVPGRFTKPRLEDSK